MKKLIGMALTAGAAFCYGTLFAESESGSDIAVGQAPILAKNSGFTYQGVLLDKNRQPISGTRPITFSIYSDRSGGTPHWQNVISVSSDTNGIFNIEVSDTAGNGSGPNQLAKVFSDYANTKLYLGISVKENSEISPRQQLMPVPKAIHADYADGSLAEEFKATGNIRTEGQFIGYGTIPVGGIIMWSGAEGDVPKGWALCDGSNNTPDLTGKFVMGAAKLSEIHETGGTNSITLTSNQLPAHAHNIDFAKYLPKYNTIDLYWQTIRFAVPYEGLKPLPSLQPSYDNYVSWNWEDSVPLIGTKRIPLGETLIIGDNEKRGKEYLLGMKEGSDEYSFDSLDIRYKAQIATRATGQGSPVDVTPAYYKLAYIMRIK